jgi:hypothetical protein
MTTTQPPFIFTYSDGSRLYKLPAKAFVSKFPVWEANRTLDVAHVASLEASIKSPTELQGLFSVISYLDEESKVQNRVIDGQHRQEVLRRHFERSPEAPDFEVLVRRYPDTTHETAIKLFQQINHAKPMVYKGSATERLHEFVAAMKRRFISERPGGSLIGLIRPSTNRPFLSTEILEEMLKTYKVHENMAVTPERLLEHAESMNAFYAEDPNRVSAKFTKATLERAVDYGFYLGLDPRCSWLQALKP